MSDIEFITEMNHRRARERELGMRYAEIAKLRDGAGADGVRGAAAGADLRRGGGGGGCGRERTV